jgi:hypothetical protein
MVLNFAGVTVPLLLALLAAIPSAQQGSSSPARGKPSEGTAACKPESLPLEVRNRLKGEFDSWKVQESGDLSPRAHARWEDEKPLACPGIAAGKFENAGTASYAVLLVPRAHPDAGYRFVVFGPKTNQPSYEMRVVGQWDNGGAANYFVHNTRISKFFDEQSKKKFHAHTGEGILLVDSAENEYEVDVYFWSGSSYRHAPIDY